MSKNSEINSILIIGSGPIIIGQACEFDYSGTQALRSIREDGDYNDGSFDGRSHLSATSDN